MTRKVSLVLALCSLACVRASAQEVQVSLANRTISVQATATVRVDPELAIVGIGYHNYGRTQDEAYTENKKGEEKIIHALLDAGVPQATIETDYLEVSAVQPDREWSAEEQTNRKYEAKQSWKIHTAPQEAQKVVDWGVAAGANEVQSVQWLVSDVQSVDDKAAIIALDKARKLGQQMAKQAGVKLGVVLSASNGPTNDMEFVTRSRTVQTVTVSEAAIPSLRLFPEKIVRTATVSMVFAIE